MTKTWHEIKRNVKNVADYIVGLIPVDILKLQNLLFCCQGITLRISENPLFYGDIRVWKYGFYMDEVYNKYIENGFDILSLDNESTVVEFLYDKDLKAIDMTLEHYGELSSLELMNRLCEYQLWKDMYKYGEYSLVPNQSIKEYFEKIITIETKK